MAEFLWILFYVGLFYFMFRSQNEAPEGEFIMKVQMFLAWSIAF